MTLLNPFGLVHQAYWYWDSGSGRGRRTVLICRCGARLVDPGLINDHIYLIQGEREAAGLEPWNPDYKDYRKGGS